MAKYARFDPRNKKQRKNENDFSSKKSSSKPKRIQNWKEYLRNEENDISSLRGKTFETV